MLSFNLRKKDSKIKPISMTLPIVWFGSTIMSIFLTLFLLLLNTQSVNQSKLIKYSVFSAKPLVLGATTSRLYSEDARAATLNAVFEKYKCPLEGYGNSFVEEADRNNIPYWLVASIAFQESSCGKKTPTVGGAETYNAWGWGVWGNNVKQFDSWEHGVATVSKYMGDKFYSKGITNTCDIMKIYTPPSNGSWCNGVNFFGDIIQNFKTPENS